MIDVKCFSAPSVCGGFVVYDQERNVRCLEDFSQFLSYV